MGSNLEESTSVSAYTLRAYKLGGPFTENMDLHYRQQMVVFKNTSFDVEQKNSRFNENDICDGELSCCQYFWMAVKRGVRAR